MVHVNKWTNLCRYTALTPYILDNEITKTRLLCSLPLAVCLALTWRPLCKLISSECMFLKAGGILHCFLHS